MKQFLTKDFLLESNTAKSLFQTAAALPIIDYRSHLRAEEIAMNKRYANIADLMLKNAPKKWQLMRSCGVDEYYITGDAGDYEKFQKWAEVLPNLIGHPIYTATHLQLQRLFQIYEPLSPATAEQIWNRANAILNKEYFTLRYVLKQLQVEVICTSEEPSDTLDWHRQILADELCLVKVLPTFCPDALLCPDQPDFLQKIQKLEDVCSTQIADYAALQSCLTERLLYFKSLGSVTADQKFMLKHFSPVSLEEADRIFQKARSQTPLTPAEIDSYQSTLLLFLAKKYNEYQFVMELQLNPWESPSPCPTVPAGAKEAAISDLSSFFQALYIENKLPKIMVFAHHPNDFIPLGNLMNSFCGGNVRGKLQFTLGDCFAENHRVIRKLIQALASSGLLSVSAGFPIGTDHLLSYAAAQLPRRVLAQCMGEWVEAGEYPSYTELLKKIMQDIVYQNAKEYFNLS